MLETMLQNGYEPAPEKPPTDQWSEIDEWSIDRAFATEVQRTDAVAMSLGLEYDEAQSLYDLSGPEPRLRVDPAKLAADRQSALREITLLVCVGRGAVGLDSGTRHVREAAAAHQRPVPDGDFDVCMESIPDVVLRGHSDSENRFVGLRDLADLPELDGQALVQRAFAEQAPILALNQRATAVERDEQAGLRYLTLGVTCAIRNVLTHDIERDVSAQDGAIWLGLIGWLHQRLDSTERIDSAVDEANGREPTQ